MPPEEFLPQFGLATFRPGQREVIEAVLAGEDALCIMPTGGGKSLCYQLPAIARPGLALVISPLIALMKDQVDALTARGVRATYINSSLPLPEQDDRLRRMQTGEYSLVYVAPERLRKSQFLEAARNVRVQLLAVDEAHCISEWGHDFRPDYARLGVFRQRLGFPQTIALTATATPEVREDVARQLQLRQPRVFITGFARENLRFEVWEAGGQREKQLLLVEFLKQTPGSGIVYAATRKRCAELVELVQSETKRRIGLYHAGLAPDERRAVQEDFMQGRLEIIAATNAFGMGIDKRDLRFVAHYNLPGTIEAYYQEAGRAGRDGLPSRCLLLFSHRDRDIQEFFIDSNYPPPSVVESVYDFLRRIEADPIELTQEELKDQLGLSAGAEAVGASEKLLEKCGALERLDARQNLAAVKIDSELPTLVNLLPPEAKVQRRVLKAVERIVGDRRGERVYFPLRAAADSAEVDATAAMRALRELCRLQDFDYVPPFRGRAVHMLVRDRPFAELKIDFDELDRRRDAEYARLDAMIAYARTRRCRQAEILLYFGEQNPPRCGMCDHCRATPPQAHEPAAAGHSPAAAPVLDAVRIALSGVARAAGRVGKTLVAKMLTGSASAQVEKLGLTRLSTFGLLADLKQTEAVELLDALIQIRLVEQVEADRFRPLVQLSDRGIAVMRGELPLEAPPPVSGELLRKLSRRSAARPAVDPPPPVAPRSEPEPIPSPVSCSAAKAREAAEYVLESPPEPEPESFFTVDEPPAAPPPPHASFVRPVWHWTWRVLSSGFTADECQQIRQIDEATLLDHLTQAAEAGLHVELSWVLAPNQLQQLERCAAGQAEPPPAALASLGIAPAHVRLYRAVRNGQRQASARR